MRFRGQVVRKTLLTASSKMYKPQRVPLTRRQAHEVRRTRKFFTPGWLENESIFLHMHYKFLFRAPERAGLTARVASRRSQARHRRLSKSGSRMTIDFVQIRRSSLPCFVSRRARAWNGIRRAALRLNRRMAQHGVLHGTRRAAVSVAERRAARLPPKRCSSRAGCSGLLP